MSFWNLIARNSASSALATAGEAVNAGADWRTVGFAAGIGVLGALLQTMLTHPMAQHPAVQAVAATPIVAAVNKTNS